MKYKILLFALFCAAKSFGQIDEQLVGQWQVLWLDTKNEMSAQELSRFEALPAESKARVEESISSRRFHFLANGQFTVEWSSASGPKNEEGTWLVNGKLMLTVGNVAHSYLWQKPSANRLILSLDGDAGSGLFSKFVLTLQQ